jgi:hypothetical protein
MTEFDKICMNSYQKKEDTRKGKRINSHLIEVLRLIYPNLVSKWLAHQLNFVF